jgi:hypothetical protein
MRVLIYTPQLSQRTGGEINIRDWSLGLKRRGHQVVVCTLTAGALAEEVRNAGVALVTDPALIGEPPDVMFGNGINETTTMIARFPSVPAIQVAQQWDNWVSYPCPSPQVVFYMPVDRLNAEMLLNEFGLPQERIRIVHNSVDLSLMPARKRPLPLRPERALIFVKANTPYVEAVAAACKRRNITLDLIGQGVGRVLANPLSAIVESDIVIGAARTAIEGAAGGAAVLVADHRGLGGMLTVAKLAHYRANNFGREILDQPADVHTIGAAIDSYDAADAAKVAELVRESASLDGQLDQLEAIFREAIEHFKRVPPDVEAARRALSSYLALHLPRFGEASPRHNRFSSAMDGPDEMKKSLAATHGHLSELGDRVSELGDRVATIESELLSLREIRVLIERNRSLFPMLRPFVLPLRWLSRKTRRS